MINYGGSDRANVTRNEINVANSQDIVPTIVDHPGNLNSKFSQVITSVSKLVITRNETIQMEKVLLQGD